jgi:hypothetical protein
VRGRLLCFVEGKGCRELANGEAIEEALAVERPHYSEGEV